MHRVRCPGQRVLLLLLLLRLRLLLVAMGVAGAIMNSKPVDESDPFVLHPRCGRKFSVNSGWCCGAIILFTKMRGGSSR